MDIEGMSQPGQGAPKNWMVTRPPAAGQPPSLKLPYSVQAIAESAVATNEVQTLSEQTLRAGE